MRRARIAAALSLWALACSSSQPSPTTPSTLRWTLSGTVKGNGAAVSGAQAKVIESGLVTTTDLNGRYTFVLQEGSYTVQAAANGYTPLTKPVTLTSNRTMDFDLPAILAADLVAEGIVTITDVALNTWTFAGQGRNRGTGCAGNVTGNDALLNGNGVTIATRGFSLPAGTIVKPGDQFGFEGCCYSTAELNRATIHQPTFMWTMVACP